MAQGSIFLDNCTAKLRTEEDLVFSALSQDWGFMPGRLKLEAVFKPRQQQLEPRFYIASWTGRNHFKGQRSSQVLSHYINNREMIRKQF